MNTDTDSANDNGMRTPRQESTRTQQRILSAEWIRLLALLVVSGATFALCVAIAVPFLPAIAWGIALAIIAWPLHRWIRRMIPSPMAAAVVSTLLVTTAILATGFFVTFQLTKEAVNAANSIQEKTAELGIRDTLQTVPVFKGATDWMERVGVDVEHEINKAIEDGSRNFGYLARGTAQGTVAAAIQFLMSIVILFYLFLDRAEFLAGFRDLLPLSKDEGDRVLASAADSVHANLYATFVTSAINTAGAGLLFWVFGLPSPVIWSIVMFVLSLLPILGAGMVWFPAVLYLTFSGQYLGAAAILGWGLFTLVFIDNFLYPRIAGERMRLHPILALIAFLGGVAVFGISGMILGPAAMAVALAFVEVWKRRVAFADRADDLLRNFSKVNANSEAELPK